MMDAKRILVLGGGFAGLWSAVGAARKLDELGKGSDAAGVTLVNRDPFHHIRVHNYEADLSRVRVPLDDYSVPSAFCASKANSPTSTCTSRS
jgi:NADH dehydrogenase